MNEKLPQKTELIIPKHIHLPSVEWKDRALMISDLKKFNVEMKMTLLETEPTFWVYYCTRIADILGKLVLFDDNLMFQPLNPAYANFMNYNSKIVLSQAKNITTPKP